MGASILINIKSWWCCLNPGEFGLLSVCLIQYLINGGWIERSTFDNLANFYLTFSVLKRTELFKQLYSLEPGEIVIGEGQTIEVYFMNGVFWPQFIVFSQTPQFICSGPCPILVFGT